MLILRVLTAGPMHGYGIAQRLKSLSSDVLAVGEVRSTRPCSASC
jgi:DNA-binding PadR family transcriptional regulator